MFDGEAAAVGELGCEQASCFSSCAAVICSWSMLKNWNRIVESIPAARDLVESSYPSSRHGTLQHRQSAQRAPSAQRSPAVPVEFETKQCLHKVR